MRGAVNTDVIEQTPATRKLRWERKLLDIGLRNTLINLRLTKSVIPILSASLDTLEDSLSDGSDFAILARPSDWHLSEKATFDSMHDFGPYAELVSSEFKNKRLRSIYTESELEDAIKNVYRTAKTSIEENGANTLYLALGLLKWFENPRSTKARYAPLVLIPVEMIRKSVAQGYVIRLRDDEPQMNITLLEKLKQDFGIMVEGVDPLPQDAHGVDVRKVFTILRKAVMEQKNWDILESAYLGIFSFSQFVMWNDIRNRADDLEKNKLVKSLMEGRLCWDAEPMEIGEDVSEDNVYLPIAADASQLFAIKEAGKGKTFVLHGPPGTGKSQTITAMIANALAKGKTVLFVAEKMAALEVVQKRLEAIGIGPFCLELHSNKSKKKDVLDQLQQASDVAKRQPQEKYQQRVEQIAKLRNELDSYAKAIHKKQRCGMSLFELINEYEANKTTKELASFDRSVIQSMDSSSLEEQTILVERLVAAAKATGHPHDHVLTPIRCTAYSQQFRIQIPQNVAAYREALKNFEPIAENLSKTLNRPCDSYADIVSLTKVVSEICKWYYYPETWAKKSSYEVFFENMHELVQEGETVNEKKGILEPLWKDEFMELDGQALLSEYQTAVAKWVLPRALGIRAITKKLAIYRKSGGSMPKTQLSDQLMVLVSYQKARKRAKELLMTLANDLEGYYKGEASDWGTIKSMLFESAESRKVLCNLTGSDDFRKEYCGNISLKADLQKYLDAEGKLEQTKKALDDLLNIDQTDSSGWIEKQLYFLQTINEHYDDIKEWINWRGIEAEALKKGLKPVVDAYVSGMSHEDVARAYRSEICKELSMEVIDNDQLLGTFSGSVFNEKIAQFKRMDNELTELTKKEIFCRLAANVPNFFRETAQSSELNILLRAIKSNGRGVSIRKLFEQIPNILPRLCPCMLMSPISAAQYLDPKRAPFDLVVFDEASQIPTCKAVGALARGKDAAIVGDPKQMPPTSFFETNTIDEDHVETEDLESILDDCLALNMPQTHLLWHYRSRHESLIAFSNHQFYDNRLFTFPSVNDRENKVTIEYINGTFERGKTRTNKAEAAAVVEELVKRCNDKELSSQSVGVVTFNVSQQNLIDDLLTEACKKDPALEEWAYNSKEPLFIKNLENVQGDERDVILFSVGYGPDQNGKVSMNFGPLNREGGWRRLNVAVSRSRCEMKVFSSLRPEMINLSRTSAAGVAALKSFLEYASGMPLTEDENTVKGHQEDRIGIVDTICATLKENGYETDRMVGHSEYKIDIGVIDPKNPERYLCGIMLDGNSYGAAKTTRDREIAQKTVLSGLGWSILRVWLMDWWDNSSKEMNRILTFLRDGNDPNDGGIGGKQEVNPSDEFLEDDEVVSTADMNKLSSIAALDPQNNKMVARAVTYKAYEFEPLYMPDQRLFYETSRYDNQIRDVMLHIVSCEAPIYHEYLIKKTAQYCGFSRTGSRIQDKLEGLIKQLNLKYSTMYNRRIYWKNEQIPECYSGMRSNGEGLASREIEEVPIYEVINAVCYVLFDQISLSEEDLEKETAKLLGYTRMGAKVTASITTAIKTAIASYMIEKNENQAWVLTKTGKKRAQSTVSFVKIIAANESKASSKTDPKPKRTIDWKTFYDKLCDWETRTIKTRINQLIDIGPTNEVLDACSFIYEPEIVDKFIIKAVDLGCKFHIKDLLEADNMTEVGYDAICSTIPKEILADSATLAYILHETEDTEKGDAIAWVALDNNVKMHIENICEVLNGVSTNMFELLVDTIAPEEFTKEAVDSCLNTISTMKYIDNGAVAAIIQKRYENL